MKKLEVPNGFDWDAPADPDHNADNYFQDTVSGLLSAELGARLSKRLNRAMLYDEVECQGDIINIVPEVIEDTFGVKMKPTRKEMLLIFSGFKIGLYSTEMMERGRNDGPEIPAELQEILKKLAGIESADNESGVRVHTLRIPKNPKKNEVS